MNRAALPRAQFVQFVATTSVASGVCMALLVLFVWQETPQQALLRGLEIGIAALVGQFIGLQLSRFVPAPLSGAAPRTRLTIALALGVALAIAIAVFLYIIARR
jgi:hypothetical protein